MSPWFVKKESPHQTNSEIIQNCGAWEKGNVVTIFLDCDEAKVTFWRDEKKLGTLEIDQNAKYYPALEECCCNGKSDYVLINAL